MQTLTREERDKLAAYLNNEAKTNSDLAIQLENLGGAPTKMMADRKRQLAKAQRLVVADLLSGESFSIGRS